MLIALFAFLLAGCSKNEKDINLNVSAVSAFYAPIDNLFVRLEPATSATVGFEWEQAKAEDGSLVMYEVGFDKVGGDFSNPVYKISSDGNGVQNRLTLSHKDLNKIANLGGIRSLETGKLIWTVFSIKGTNVKKATVTRTIELQRPAGFADIPSEVYITGSATEGGATLSSAIKMKSTGSGIYEIYTQLKPGNFHFVNKITGTPATYIMQGNLLKDGADAASPATTPKVYRIELDFNNASAKISEITSVGYWFAPRNALEAQLTYIGNGKFKAAAVPIQFRQESWGRDERYKFRVAFKDAAGAPFTEDWASSQIDNSRPVASTPASYYYVFKQNVDQWNYSFKFQTEADLKNVDLTLSFSPDGPYTHIVKIL